MNSAHRDKTLSGPVDPGQGNDGNTACDATGSCSTSERIDSLFDLLRLPPELAARVSHADDVPARIGRYPVVRRLGRGGFGAVYLGYDDRLERPVAIKVPAGRRAHLLADARKAAALRHPGIVTVHAIEEGPDDSFFVVMEYLEGGSLANRMEAGRRMSAREVARFVAKVADAAGHAHAHGVVHRDLKPENILLDRQSQPHIADFGLAIFGKQSDGTGDVCGTAKFMAPEQIRATPHRLDGQTDVWSLGVLLYELLTGQAPFAGTSRVELFDRILHSTLTPPRRIDSSIPRKLQDVVCKCLEKQSTLRYQSAADLADALRQSLRTPRATRFAVAVVGTLAILLAAVAVSVSPDRDGLTASPGSELPAPVKADAAIGTNTRRPGTGTAERELPVSSPTPPTIGQLVASPRHVMDKARLTLTARDVTDAGPSGRVIRVSFYRDANGDGLPQAGELLGSDEDGHDGWSTTVRASFGVGRHAYLARATNVDDRSGNVVSTTGRLIDASWKPVLLVSNRTGSRVTRFDALSGQLIDVVASGGLLDPPTGIAIGPDGLLYVASGNAKKILRYRLDPTGFVDVFVGDDPKTPGDESGGLFKPRDLLFDKAGNLLVATGESRMVLRYDRNGRPFPSSFGTPGSAEFIRAGGGGLDQGTLGHLNGLTVGDDGLLYVTNYLSGHGVTNDFGNVLRFNTSSGQFVGEFVSTRTRLIEGWGLTSGPDGDVFVASFKGHTSERYDGQTGKPVKTFHGHTVSACSDVAIGCNGELYVSSYTGDAVVVLDASTGLIRKNLITAGLKGPSKLLLYFDAPGVDGRYLDASFRPFRSESTAGGPHDTPRESCSMRRESRQEIGGKLEWRGLQGRRAVRDRKGLTYAMASSAR